jgi:hypothetical protein
MRKGWSVTVMTRARKTGPMMSDIALAPARAIVRAAAPKRNVRANGRACWETSLTDLGMFFTWSLLFDR